MKVALLGLEKSGKKTFFTLLTGREVPAGLKEGECIEGIAPIRDPRVDVLAGICKPERKKYAENIVVLCPDIKEGSDKKLWMEPARKSDLLCVVVREFSSSQVYHPSGSVDAGRDMKAAESELVLSDLMLLETRLDRLGKEKRAGQTPKQALEEKALLRIKERLEKEMRPVAVELGQQEQEAVKSLGLLCQKPVLWALNVDEDRLAAEPGDGPNVFRVSCLIERETMGLDSDAERQEYMKSLGLEASGLDRLNQSAYSSLGLMSFYTIGEDEVRAWTVCKGAAAPTAAGKVHTDIERGFIRAEIIKYDDLVAAGSEAAVKAAGKYQVKGRDYVMEDGDICHFRFNV